MVMLSQLRCIVAILRNIIIVSHIIMAMLSQLRCIVALSYLHGQRPVGAAAAGGAALW